MPATDSSRRHLFLAFMTYTGDRSRFYDWYDEVHIPEMLQAPGVRSVQRFEHLVEEPPVGAVALDWGHLALYEFDSELTPFRDFVAERIGSGALQTPDYVDQPPRTLLLRADGAADLADGGAGPHELRERRLLLAMTGGPDAGVDWYDNDGVAAIMSVTGMVRAQRFVDADVAPWGPPAPTVTSSPCTRRTATPGRFATASARSRAGRTHRAFSPHRVRPSPCAR